MFLCNKIQFTDYFFYTFDIINQKQIQMKFYTCYAFLLLLIIACNNQNQKPKVIYDAVKTTVKNNPVVEDEVEISDLPVQIDGTRYILHPVGSIRVGVEGKKYGGNSYVLSNYNRFELTGNFSNLKFQHQDSTSFKTLTDKNIAIQNVTYLNAVAKSITKQFLVYTLEDLDSNKDGKLDDNDIKDLYISNANGSNFIKLSPDLQEVIDWKLIESQNRLYFRSVEDNNKNGAFDKEDKVHYYYVDLTNKELKVDEYNPIN